MSLPPFSLHRTNTQLKLSRWPELLCSMLNPADRDSEGPPLSSLLLSPQHFGLWVFTEKKSTGSCDRA